jgi:hypothetical protein
MLSLALLEALRSDWRGLRHKPTVWLFLGNRWHTSNWPATTKILWTAYKHAALRTDLEHKHNLSVGGVPQSAQVMILNAPLHGCPHISSLQLALRYQCGLMP